MSFLRRAAQDSLRISSFPVFPARGQDDFSHNRVQRNTACDDRCKEWGGTMDFDQNATFNYGNVFQGMQYYSELEIAETLHMPKDAARLRLLMMKYESAIQEVRTKLEILNREMSLKYQRNPFESIKSRLKTPASIHDKLVRRGFEVSYDSLVENLNDIAGVRVICSFVDDIYMLADCLKKQDDVVVLQEKDYLKDPKDNGYRSLHLIIKVPIFLTADKELVKVEVQFRTIAMDFWATLEHKMKYKKDIENAEIVSEEMRLSADLINQLDRRMQQIRDHIDSGKVSRDVIEDLENELETKNAYQKRRQDKKNKRREAS